MGRIIDRTGTIGVNNRGSKMIIVDCRRANDLDVYFPQYKWTAYHRRYDQFKNGEIGCPYEPTVAKVGYMGEGEYVGSSNTNRVVEYTAWCNILNQCYNPNNNYYSAYGGEGYTVSKEWHNYQNFARWYNENKYEIEGHDVRVAYKLSKSKVISPKTTVFAPMCIIGLLRRSGGITYRSCSNNYIVVLHYTKLNGENHTLYCGEYCTERKAKMVYKKKREELVRTLAEEYIECIPSTLYRYMKKYKVDVNDISVEVVHDTEIIDVNDADVILDIETPKRKNKYINCDKFVWITTVVFILVLILLGKLIY